MGFMKEAFNAINDSFLRGAKNNGTEPTDDEFFGGHKLTVELIGGGLLLAFFVGAYYHVCKAFCCRRCRCKCGSRDRIEEPLLGRIPETNTGCSRFFGCGR